MCVSLEVDYDALEGEFSWDLYLAKTSASAVPPRAFKPRNPVGFKTGMKLECVDPKNPQLIRVATVAAVKVFCLLNGQRFLYLTFIFFLLGLPTEDSL
jgi:hypothetical protein